MNIKPKSRKENIVIQELEKELLIYDLKINKAFSLNETCAMVWQECDGNKSIAEIASTLSVQTKGLVNEEVVWLALETLQKENLLANSDGISSKFNGMSRREVIRKVGFATMVALPLISSVVAPSAAMAQSGNGLLALNSSCSTNNQCASGFCVNPFGQPTNIRRCCGRGGVGFFLAPGTFINSSPPLNSVTCPFPVGAVNDTTCCSANTVFTGNRCLCA